MSRSSTTSIRSRRWFLKQGLWLPVAPAILHAANWGGFKDPFGAVNQPAEAAGGGGPTIFFQENFEDASVGFDTNNTNGWTNSGGCNPKYATAPDAPLAGNQSLRDPAGEYCWAAFTDKTEVWGYCLFRSVTLGGSGGPRILDMRNGTTAIVEVRVDYDNTDRLVIKCPAVTGTTYRTNAGISAATNYRLWWHYKSGGGTDAIFDVEWQDTSTARVGSGDNYKQLTDGTTTTAANRIYLNNDAGAEVHIFDTIVLTSDAYYVP